MPDSDQILDVVVKVVKRQLAPAQIVKVRCEEDFDHDGDPILRIEIVFDGDKLDPKKVVGLPRHLRDPLAKVYSEDRFPVISFQKPGELDGAAA